jgi:hypothetical protein
MSSITPRTGSPFVYSLALLSLAVAPLTVRAADAAGLDGAGSPIGAQVIQGYGRLATANASLSCSQITFSGFYCAIAPIASAGTIYLPAIGFVGPVQVTGADGTSRQGWGTVGLASIAQYNPATRKLSLAGGAIGQYSVDMGTTMPQSQADAEQLFDAAFGTASRYGAPLKYVRADRGTSPAAYYGVASRTVTGADGAVSTVVGLFGITRKGARVYAQHTSAIGAFVGMMR